MSLTYKVIVDIAQPVSPPYGEWLHEHVQDMLELTTPHNVFIFTDAEIDSIEREDGSATYTVAYTTNADNLAYYEETFAEKMRNAFKETYTDTSLFKFERDVVPQ